MNAVVDAEVIEQHLIDPEICIRCNTCEATCPIGAITHDERNYVVHFEKCNACNACIAPCPTGAIDNWRRVANSAPYSVAEQFCWDSLPAQAPSAPGSDEGMPAEVATMTAAATAGQGGAVAAPASAERPTVNLYTAMHPAIARVCGNFRLTDTGASSDVRHLVLDFGGTAFPVLEGQSIGIQPPGADAEGHPHHLRLYSVASPRDGERRGYNNLSLTVKRVRAGIDGNSHDGVCSNYLCDLRPGDEVRVLGPYGSTFLMPNHAGAKLLMVCTGTGSAPMRAMTERRRRLRALHGDGELMLFFGARAPNELPYFGPLMRLPRDFIDINLAFSRVPGHPRRYVQDLIRERATDVMRLLADDQTHIYICGLKGMEAGVDEAFDGVCRAHGVEWVALLARLRADARYHVETY